MRIPDPILTQALEQAGRIAATPRFGSADSLNRLLLYLARAAVEISGQPMTEARIAADVFGRGQQFDPRTDSTVRVQASRLRGRLVEYYQTRGAEDEIILELPRGQYHLRIRSRAEPEKVVEAVAAPPPGSGPACPWGRLALAALAGFAAGGALMFLLYPVLVPLR